MVSIFILLAIGATISAFVVFKNILRQQKHLDMEIIRLFMINQLSENERNRVISHLGICEECQNLLHEYNNGKPLEDHLIDDNE